MCRIKSEIYSTAAGWIWATWAKSRIGPIWFPFVIYMVCPCRSCMEPCCKTLSVPYGLPILDPYKIPYGTLTDPILFAGCVVAYSSQRARLSISAPIPRGVLMTRRVDDYLLILVMEQSDQVCSGTKIFLLKRFGSVW